MARRIGAQTLFAEATAGILWADAPLTLFGRTRRDRRFDLTAGLLFNRWRIAGELAPLVRIRRIVNRSTVDVWDFRQTRVEFALSREF